MVSLTFSWSTTACRKLNTTPPHDAVPRLTGPRRYIGADLTYLNFVVGVVVMFMFIPVQTWLFTRDRLANGGVGRPEARFLVSLVTVWGFPISLLWFAFTCDGNTSYWSPVVAGGLLGFCDPLLWLGMLNYIADAYTNVAASAVAAFLIPSFVIAAGCAHAGEYTDHHDASGSFRY